MNPKNYKKDAKKKNLLAMESSKELERSSFVDEKIICTTL